MAITLPLGIRVAAGLVGMAIDRLSTIPGELPSLAVTVAGQALRTSMRVQQEVAELATRGDDLLSPLTGRFQENPPWATFDEDDDQDDDDDSAPDRVASRPARSDSRWSDDGFDSAVAPEADDVIESLVDDGVDDLELVVLDDGSVGNDAASVGATVVVEPTTGAGTEGSATKVRDATAKAGARRRKRAEPEFVDVGTADRDGLGAFGDSAPRGPFNPASFVVGTGSAPEAILDGLPDHVEAAGVTSPAFTAAGVEPLTAGALTAGALTAAELHGELMPAGDQGELTDEVTAAVLRAELNDELTVAELSAALTEELTATGPQAELNEELTATGPQAELNDELTATALPTALTAEPAVDQPAVDLPGFDLRGFDLRGVDQPGVDLAGGPTPAGLDVSSQFTPAPAPAKPVANARRTTAKPRARTTIKSDHRLSIAELKERTQGMDTTQVSALLAQEEAGPNRAAYLTLLANRLMTLQHENR